MGICQEIDARAVLKPNFDISTMNLLCFFNPKRFSLNF